MSFEAWMETIKVTKLHRQLVLMTAKSARFAIHLKASIGKVLISMLAGWYATANVSDWLFL